MGGGGVHSLGSDGLVLARWPGSRTSIGSLAPTVNWTMLWSRWSKCPSSELSFREVGSSSLPSSPPSRRTLVRPGHSSKISREQAREGADLPTPSLSVSPLRRSTDSRCRLLVSLHLDSALSFFLFCWYNIEMLILRLCVPTVNMQHRKNSHNKYPKKTWGAHPNEGLLISIVSISNSMQDSRSSSCFADPPVLDLPKSAAHLCPWCCLGRCLHGFLCPLQAPSSLTTHNLNRLKKQRSAFCLFW